jgi:hypothetical protein
MSPTPRLPDLSVADAGRTFVMRPGSQRLLVLGATEPAPTISGESTVVGLEALEPDDAAGRRYRVTALERGRTTITSGEATWHIDVRGAPSPPAQTRDDTDSGWGERDSARSQRWWEEQRPPHW